MFKFIHSQLLSFDIEWIPDPMAGEILHGIRHNPPHSYQDSFEALWRAGGATDEMPQIYIKTVLCRIVSIAGIFRETSGEGEPTLKLVTIPSETADPGKCDEKEILRLFIRGLETKRPQIVGYNSYNADVPIIIQRAIVHGLFAKGLGERPQKPWEGVDYFASISDYNVDLQSIVGRYGRLTPSLHEMASLSGIPGKIGVSGDSVADMWLAGDLKGIVDYNECDAFTTHLLWARIAHFSGLMTTEEYEREQRLVRELLDEEIAKGKAHLNVFKREWDRLRVINQRILTPLPTRPCRSGSQPGAPADCE